MFDQQRNTDWYEVEIGVNFTIKDLWNLKEDNTTIENRLFMELNLIYDTRFIDS